MKPLAGLLLLVASASLAQSPTPALAAPASAAAERLKTGGLLVIETPNIDSLPFKVLQSRWRQFIPEHYFFFSPDSISRLLSEQGLTVKSVMTIGKYASLDLIMNRLGRYLPWLPSLNGFSRFTFRMNPMDIMLVFASKHT